MSTRVPASRPDADRVLVDIADYVLDYRVDSRAALETARYCLIDALGCALEALDYPACSRLLGPVVPGTEVPNGACVPGTDFRLDPVRAAFSIGTMIRWLDFNDTWLAAEWGHPSDNLGGILAIADWLSRTRVAQGGAPLLMRQVLEAMVKAYEIQGILALENSFNRVGLDHVVLVKVATAAVCTWLLGGDRGQIINALSQAFVDGQPLRSYRHAPNTGSRKSWAAGDATARGVFLALLSRQGEMGCPAVLTAPKWGFYDVLFRGHAFRLPRPYGSYVIENILFKISFPAEFHAQTAVECALELHTHESALRIIDKQGPLHNPADRDHCLQYMVAVALLRGRLTAADYEDDAAADPRIDPLRARMVVSEEPRFSADYLDPGKRSIANALQVFFTDGSRTPEVTIEYPLGHCRRRTEGIPVLVEKFRTNLARRFPAAQQARIEDSSRDVRKLGELAVNEYLDQYVP